MRWENRPNFWSGNVSFCFPNEDGHVEEVVIGRRPRIQTQVGRY